MKKNFKLIVAGLCLVMVPVATGCSKDDEPDDMYVTKTIGFQNVPSTLIGGPTSYGANLYDGATGQITTGYLAPVDNYTYAQFSINYGYNYNASFQMADCYTFYNGGLAVSNWHDMSVATFENQLSVYSTTSPSGGNFVVTNGFSNVSNPRNAKYSDYEGCGKVYLTDATGYRLVDNKITGEDKEGYFKSVYINNTTYAFLNMRDGNAYSEPLSEANEGWFKVQFIAFEDDDANDAPLGYTEAYLANFKKGQADGYMGIIDEWMQVDLSSLPKCSILVINFVGSDTGEWGLNTPGYCSLDQFVISVEKD